MTRTLLVAALATSLLAAAPASGPVTLTEALRAAVSKSKVDDARGELAASQLRFLEASNKWKFELRPTLGMFAFSNPGLLAASLGSSLLMGRRGAPTPLALANAKFDVLATEMSSERLRVRTEIETARAFFNLLEKQQVATQLKRAVVTKQKKVKEVERLLQVARVTELDRIGFQQELLDLQQQQIEVEMQRRAASVQLASLMGRLEVAEELEVEDVNIANASLGTSLPPLEKLIESAFFYRKESQMLKDRIEALHQKAGTKSKASAVESISFGYSYLANGMTGMANTAQSMLLGGNTGQTGINFAIPLKKNGVKEAEREVLAARIKVLEAESRVMENELRTELMYMRSAVQASVERLQLASRRVELGKTKEKMLKARADHGMGEIVAAVNGEESDIQAEAALVQANCARKTSLFTLMVICGLQDQREEIQQQVLNN